MTLEDLKYFFEVARCLNFSKAAANLYITQPNLTKHISRLESELGIRLFDRSTHHCRLTDEGLAFFNKNEDLFFSLNTSIEDAKMRGKIRYKQIYIGIAPGELPILPLMEVLRRRNLSEAAVRYVLRQANYPDMIEKLYSRELDLLITTDRNARNRPEFEHMMFPGFRLVLAVNRAHPLADRERLAPIDFRDEILFFSLPDGKYAPPSCLDEFNRSTGVGLNLTILPSPSDVMDNVLVNAGIALVPDTVDPVRYPEVRFCEFEDNHPGGGQAVIWRKNETSPFIPPLLEEFRTVCDTFLPE